MASHILRRSTSVFLSVALAASALSAQTPRLAQAPTSARWQTAVATARANAQQLLVSNGLPGLSVAVGVGNDVVYSEGFGYADLENRVPVTPLTRMRIGSVSKSITSLGLALLAQEGKLDLDAEVQKYVPSFPRKRWPITVREVAGHTAGIRHYKNEQENYLTTRYTNVTAPLAIFENDSLLFEPGTRFSYSSFGWNLISAVIEGAAGENFLSFMRRRVFEPLALRSIVAEYTDSIVPYRARFYERGRDSLLLNANYADNSYKWAGGGFISNTEDLVRVGLALVNGQLLEPDALHALWTSQKLKDGKETGYGMGWFVGKDAAGRRVVWHTGGSVGGRAVLVIWPDQKVVAAMLSNAGHAPMSPPNALKIAEPFLTGS